MSIEFQAGPVSVAVFKVFAWFCDSGVDTGLLRNASQRRADEPNGPSSVSDTATP